MSADRCPACGKELTYRLVVRDGVTRREGICTHCDRYKIITEEERNEWQRKGMIFTTACPFLSCLETGPHFHPVCPECGAVGYGNLYCDTCRSQWPEMLAEFKRVVEDAIATGTI